MDLIKFGNFIFFRNFSSKKNIWVFSKYLVIFYWKKLSCLEMHFAPSWAVWAIKLFFKKYFLEKVFLWKVKQFALNCATKSCTPFQNSAHKITILKNNCFVNHNSSVQVPCATKNLSLPLFKELKQLGIHNVAIIFWKCNFHQNVLRSI